MAKLKSISFVMPVLNEEDYLELAVESVFAQQTSGKTELVLALGPSKDKTNEIANQLKVKYKSKIVLVENPTGLTSAGLNAAIAASNYEVVLRVDAHSELSEGYAKLAVEVLNATGATNVGGMMIAKGKSHFQKAVAYGYNNKVGLGGGSFHVGGDAGPADTVYLGVFKKADLESLGGFSTSWVRGQDWELNKRIRQSGRLVWFDPRLKVGYYPRRSWQALAKQFLNTGIWRGALTKQDPAEAALRYWLPPLLVASLLLVFPAWFYLAIIAVVAASAAELAPKSKLWLMVVLPTMHLSWGLGFWVGLFRGLPRA